VGLFLADAAQTWRAPFYALTAGSVGVWLLAMFVVPPLRVHLVARSVGKATIWQVLTRPAHARAFALMTGIVFGGVFMFPFLAGFLVKNVGLTTGGLQLMYVLSGLATLVTMNVTGRLADRYPRLLLFRILGLLALVPIYLVTILQPGTSLPVVLAVTTAMIILASARLVPLTAVGAGIAPPPERGTVLSILA